jgi:hypothetical protein
MKNVNMSFYGLISSVFYYIDVEQTVMQFGRMSENEFSCDFRYPLSLIQAFGVALSALESRMFRE